MKEKLAAMACSTIGQLGQDGGGAVPGSGWLGAAFRSGIDYVWMLCARVLCARVARARVRYNRILGSRTLGVLVRSACLGCLWIGRAWISRHGARRAGVARRRPRRTWMGRAGWLLGRCLLLVLIGSCCRLVAQNAPTPPQAPQLPIPGITVSGEPGELGLSMQILLLLTLLTLLPAMIASLTPFLRLLIVLHFLRQAVGTQTAPGNQTLLGLALFLTIVLMQPVADQVHAEAIVPLEKQEIGQWEAFEKAQGPIKRYLSRYVREQDVALFLEVTKQPRPRNLDDLSLKVLMPAYVLSELRIGFQIGAVLFLPFLVIDLLVASITLSLGMIQLPPVMISVPFKLLLFVLVDGWNLVVGSLVRGFY